MLNKNIKYKNIYLAKIDKLDVVWSENRYIPGQSPKSD